jgi:predicted SAM-dependent methyltransferase
MNGLRLNLGCGAEGHPAFVNVDIAAGPGIVRHDLRHGVPFPDATYDLVYNSTMLSMLRPSEALKFIQECRRVLKPGGVLRVVTEDLEQMCRVYLEKLEAAYAGDKQSEKDYEWMILELYDQATRESAGGQMARYLSEDPLPNEAFIYARVGEQGRRIVSGVRSRTQTVGQASRPAGRSLPRRLRAAVRKTILTAILGADGLNAFELGRFRQSSGQVSYRMYDRYSLRQLFLDAGLSGISLRSPTESAYPYWNDVNLDVSPEGRAARPHALIMEGIRAA